MGTEQEPDVLPKRTRWIILGVWIAYSLILGSLYSRKPPSSDDSVYDYIGWALLRGESAYVEVADNNWPGIFYFHVLSVALFGNTPWSYHLLDSLLLLPACGVLFAFLRRAFGLGPAIVVVPLYQALYMSQNSLFSGQRDIVAAPLLILAAYSLWRRIEGGRRRWLAVQGACVGIAVLIRPTFLILSPFLALAELLLRKKTGRRFPDMVRDHALALAVTFGVFGLSALIGWPSGATREWYRMAVLHNLAVDVHLTETVGGVLRLFWEYAAVSWHWMLLLLFIASLTHWKSRLLPAALLGAIALSTGVSAVVQKKGYPYHWGPLLSLLSLAIAPLIFEALQGLYREPPRVFRTRTVHRALCLLLCAVVTLGLGKKLWSGLGDEFRWMTGRLSTREFYSGFNAGDLLPYDTAIEIANYVAETVPPDRTVFYWGQPRTINYLAKRRNFSRFASTYPLSVPVERDRLSPEAYQRLFKTWEDEVRKGLAEQPPEMILLQRSTTQGETYWSLETVRKDEKLGYLFVDAAHADYYLERTIDGVECYRRKPR